MRDDENRHAAGEDPAQQIVKLRAALQCQREALQAERRQAQRWEREAVLRASTVAGSLMTHVLAAQHLAAAVERNLAKLSDGGSATQELKEALDLFHETARGA